MKLKIFSVYDEKAEAYLQPIFLDTVGMALRSITDLVNDSGHMFCKHASDYTLFQLGELDNVTGEIVSDKKMLHNLVELKTQQEMYSDPAQLSIVQED